MSPRLSCRPQDKKHKAKKKKAENPQEITEKETQYEEKIKQAGEPERKELTKNAQKKKDDRGSQVKGVKIFLTMQPRDTMSSRKAGLNEEQLLREGAPYSIKAYFPC